MAAALVAPVLSATTNAVGQDVTRNTAGDISRAGEKFERVDEGAEDQTPLSVSLRQRELGLQSATEFNHVYRVPGRDDLFMRVDGGLYAVFERSFYVPFPAGVFPVVPNNTVFHIGRPALDTLLAPPSPDTPREGIGAYRLYQTNRINPRIYSRIDPELAGIHDQQSADEFVQDQPPMQSRMPTNILTDRRYRVKRLQQLMNRAAAATALRAEEQQPVEVAPATPARENKSTALPPTNPQPEASQSDGSS